MAENVLSALCQAASDCSEVILTVYGSSGLFHPHAVFTHPETGVLTIAAIDVPVDVLRFLAINRIEDVTFTGQQFNPDPRFDSEDSRYRSALAISTRR